MTRLSLDEARHRLLAFLPERATDLTPALDRLGSATVAAWDCVVFELRPDRTDVMAAFRPPRPALDGDTLLSVTTTRSWSCAPVFPLWWYEWDCPDGVPRAPLESICVSDSILGTQLQPKLHEALDVLCDPQRAALWAPAIERLVGLLGGAGELLHIAPLAPRGLSRLRLTFHVSAEHIVGWLGRIGWPEETQAIRPALFSVAVPGERLGVQLELVEDGSLGAYLSVETREFRHRGLARNRMRPLLQSISRFAALPADWIERLPDWPGPSGELLQHGYTKLVHSRGEWSAKAYLGMTAPDVAAVMHAVEAQLSAKRWGGRRGPTAPEPPHRG